MKTYKLVDFYGNFIILVAIVLINYLSDINLIYYGYGAFCLWHIQSMLVHCFFRNNMLQHNKRKTYATASIIICSILIGVIVIIKNNALFESDILFFVVYILPSIAALITPFMAVYYIIICKYELDLMYKRPLSFIK